MPRVYTVKKARKARPEHDIAVGDTYYWWKFRRGGIRYSKTMPKRSQLTQSPFKQWLFDFEDGLRDRIVDGGWMVDDFESAVEQVVDELQEQLSEVEYALEAIPEQLRDTSFSGELLTERIDGLQSWIDELQGIDTSNYVERLENGEEYEDLLNELADEIEGTNPGLS